MTPLWSLAVEEQFYFVWPFVVFFTSEKTLKKVALGIAIAAPILRAIYTPVASHSVIYCLTPFRADTLALGSFVAIAERENRKWIGRHRQQALACTLISGIALCALSVFHTFRLTADTEFFNILGYSLVAIMFGGAVVYVLECREGIIHRILTAKVLRYFGQISYSFYLYHFGVLFILRQYLPFHDAHRGDRLHHHDCNRSRFMDGL